MSESLGGSGDVGSSTLMDESDMELTPAEVLQELHQAWLNEKFSPELLPHKFDVVDCIVDQLHAMEENLSRSQSKNAIRNSLHKVELERIRYVLCSYLRKRLEKIEKFVFFCLEDDNKRKAGSQEPKMSKEERKFARDFYDLVTQHLEGAVLSKMPANVQTLDYSKIAPRPNLDEYVFLRVEKDIDNPTYDVPDLEQKDWEKGSQHLVPYKFVKTSVESGDVALI